MPNYQNGKIYVLKRTKDNKVFYVGSTVSPLSKRLGEHKSALQQAKTKNYTVYKYINKKGGRDSFYIELYKRYPCDGIEELRRMEGRVIQRLKGKGIDLKNKIISGRTHSEYTREYSKTEKGRKWYKEHSKKMSCTFIICECGRQYSLTNKARHMKSSLHKRIVELQQADESE